MAASKLTAREKKERAKIKKELQGKGILPPDKPRLNRKKFVEEAMQEWNNRDTSFLAWEVYLFKAVSWMLGHRNIREKVTLEAVGVAKVLKLAVRLKEFHEDLKKQGETKYKLTEEYEFIKDILDA